MSQTDNTPPASPATASAHWNKNHNGIKRILTELRELESNPSDDFHVIANENNLFCVHFVLRGPPDSEFEGGLYHGRIILPENYPFKAPDIELLTPNGRFETNKKICLSITSYHQETWSPSWGIRSILMALIAFMPTKAEGIGSINYTKDQRKAMAKKSLHWKCSECGKENCEYMPIKEPRQRSASSAAAAAQPEAVQPTAEAATQEVPAEQQTAPRIDDIQVEQVLQEREVSDPQVEQIRHRHSSATTPQDEDTAPEVAIAPEPIAAVEPQNVEQPLRREAAAPAPAPAAAARRAEPALPAVPLSQRSNLSKLRLVLSVINLLILVNAVTLLYFVYLKYVKTK